MGIQILIDTGSNAVPVVNGTVVGQVPVWNGTTWVPGIGSAGGQVFSVLFQGVTGDGVTDDTSAIHAAFVLSATSGTIASFPTPPGSSYLVNSAPEMPPGLRVTFGSNVTFTGAGATALSSLVAQQALERATSIGLPVSAPFVLSSSSPLDISGGQAWFPTTREVTVVGGLVSAMVDESGAGNNVAQPVGANQPGFNQFDADYGDAPSLFFTGNNFLSTDPTNAKSGQNTFTQPLTFYMVGKITNATGAFFDGVVNRISVRTGGGNWEFYAGNLVVGGANDGVPHVFCFVCNGAASALYIDRMDVPSFSGNAGAGSLDILELGGNPGLGDGAVGSLAVFAMYKGAHSSAQRERIALSIGQISGPDSIIICNGNSLTLGPGGPVIPYPTQLGTMLADPTIAIINNGVGGETTPNMNIYSQTNTDPLFTAKWRKAVTVEWEITNDLFFGATVPQAYANIINDVLARRAVGFKALVATVLPRANAGTPVGFEASRLAVNQRIRANWPSFADGLIDIGADPRIGQAGQEADPNWYDGSLVHLNTAGMGLMARLTQQAFSQLTWP